LPTLYGTSGHGFGSHLTARQTVTTSGQLFRGLQNFLAAGLAAAISETAEREVLLVDKVATPKRFYNMLSEFKGSNLDYVIFDMPPVGGTSSTAPLAGFMDTVLLVVEAEKSNRDAVKRAYAELAAKTKVSVVFNKSRSYGPKWLEAEI